MSRQFLARLAGTPVFASAVSLADRVDRERPDLLRVLTYHRVDSPDARPSLSPSLLSATPAAFEAQMKMIATRFTPVSVQQVLDYYANGSPLPPRPVLVTFDDAYCDFAEQAWPVLQRFSIPVVLFVPTAFPDHPDRRLWWDQLFDAISRTSKHSIETEIGQLPLATRKDKRRAFKRMRHYVKTLPHRQAMGWVESTCYQLGADPPTDNHIMGWDQLRRLAQEGVTLGAHTQTHPMLDRVDVNEACREAVESYHDLQREIGEVLPIFAYPSGGFTMELARALEAGGFQLAFTTVRGLNDLHQTDRLLLRRINVGSSTPLPGLHAQLLPSSTILHRFLH